MDVDEAGAVADAVKVTVATHVGLHGLFVNADAVTPLGSAVNIVNVTGDVRPDVSVAVAVSTPPAPPSVIDREAGLAARMKLKPVATISVKVAV